jgi:hypothetical protein
MIIIVVLSDEAIRVQMFTLRRHDIAHIASSVYLASRVLAFFLPVVSCLPSESLSRKQLYLKFSLIE